MMLDHEAALGGVIAPTASASATPPISFTTREGLRCIELWFDEACPSGRYDVVNRYQASRAEGRSACKDFHTLVVDLERTPDAIHASFQRNTRQKLKQALQDDALTTVIDDAPDDAQLLRFIDFYDGFAADKGIWPLWMPRMQAYRRAGILTLSRAEREGETLVWHANIRRGERFVVMYSASYFRGATPEFRNVVGRANRLLHWREMLHAKALGYRGYDFCGWYAGGDDESLLMVNRFKEEFGGDKRLEFNTSRDLTLRAKATRLAKKAATYLPKDTLLRLVRRV